MNLTESTAAYVVGTLPPERLPGVAADALEKGLDSTSLAVLAGESTRSDSRDLRDLFESALRELGFVLPSLLEASHVLKRYYAAQVADGRLQPREGAGLIVERVFRKVDHLLPGEAYLGESFGIARLIGLYYDYDDVDIGDAQSIAEIDQAIADECARIVTQEP